MDRQNSIGRNPFRVAGNLNPFYSGIKVGTPKQDVPQSPQNHMVGITGTAEGQVLWKETHNNILLQFGELKQEKEELTQQLEDRELKLKRLRAALSLKAAECEEVRELKQLECESYLRLLDKLRLSQDSLATNFNQLRSDSDRKTEQLETAFQTEGQKQKDMETSWELESLQTKTLLLQKELERTSKKLKHANSDKVELEAEKTELNNRSVTLQDLFANSQIKVKEFTAELQSLKEGHVKEIEELRERFHEKQEEAAILFELQRKRYEAQMKEFAEYREITEPKLHKLTARCNQARKKMRTLQSEFKVKMTQNMHLQVRLAEVVAERDIAMYNPKKSSFFSRRSSTSSTAGGFQEYEQIWKLKAEIAMKEEALRVLTDSNESFKLLLKESQGQVDDMYAHLAPTISVQKCPQCSGNLRLVRDKHQLQADHYSYKKGYVCSLCVGDEAAPHARIKSQGRSPATWPMIHCTNRKCLWDACLKCKKPPTELAKADPTQVEGEPGRRRLERNESNVSFSVSMSHIYMESKSSSNKLESLIEDKEKALERLEESALKDAEIQSSNIWKAQVEGLKSEITELYDDLEKKDGVPVLYKGMSQIEAL